MPHLRKLKRSKREYILCGDWNIAHKQIDLRNWRSNQKNSGFLPEERAWMDRLLGRERLHRRLSLAGDGARSLYLVVESGRGLGQERRMAN